MADIVFGPFSLDMAATRLLRDGVEVRLRPQALQALKVLLRHGGETIRYDPRFVRLRGEVFRHGSGSAGL